MKNTQNTVKMHRSGFWHFSMYIIKKLTVFYIIFLIHVSFEKMNTVHPDTKQIKARSL